MPPSPAPVADNGSLPHAIPGNRSSHPARASMLTLDVGACQVGGYLFRHDPHRGLWQDQCANCASVYQLRAGRAAAWRWTPCAPGDRSAAKLTSIAAGLSSTRAIPAVSATAWATAWACDIHENPRFAMSCPRRLVHRDTSSPWSPACTMPGLGGCRIEDMAIITPDGYIDAH